MNNRVAGAGSAESGGDSHGDSRLMPFIDAVAAQLVRTAAEEPGAHFADEGGWRAQLGSLLAAITRGASEPVCARLASDPLLLAAFFQNVDLLYAAAAPQADDVSLVILDALHRAVEEDAGPLAAEGVEMPSTDRQPG